MKRGLIIAAALTPLLAAGAGVVIGRFASADAASEAQPCDAPSVTLDMAEGVSMAIAGPDSVAACEGAACMVTGPELVEVQADGRVQCVNVTEGQMLSLTRRSDGVSLVVTETGR